MGKYYRIDYGWYDSLFGVCFVDSLRLVEPMNFDGEGDDSRC